MTDQEFQDLAAEINRKFTIRLKLAELAGRPKINPKNYNALMEFDSTIAELFLEVAKNNPSNLAVALTLV